MAHLSHDPALCKLLQEVSCTMFEVVVRAYCAHEDMLLAFLQHVPAYYVPDEKAAELSFTSCYIRAACLWFDCWAGST